MPTRLPRNAWKTYRTAGCRWSTPHCMATKQKEAAFDYWLILTNYESKAAFLWIICRPQVLKTAVDLKLCPRGPHLSFGALENDPVVPPNTQKQCILPNQWNYEWLILKWVFKEFIKISMGSRVGFQQLSNWGISKASSWKYLSGKILLIPFFNSGGLVRSNVSSSSIDN